MLPPEYMHLIVEERQRQLRTLARPLGVATAIHTLRLRLADALVGLGMALTIPTTTIPAHSPSTARTPPQ